MIRRHIKLATYVVITPFILFLFLSVADGIVTLDNIVALEILKRGNFKIFGIAIVCIIAVFWRDIYTWKKIKDSKEDKRGLTEKRISNIAIEAKISHYALLIILTIFLNRAFFWYS